MKNDIVPGFELTTVCTETKRKVDDTDDVSCEATKFHNSVHALGTRRSDVNADWDKHLGAAVTSFSPKYLPTVRAVLCRYLHMRTENTTTTNGTGRAQADSVYQVCGQWNLLGGKVIKGMCFDTTASNSGKKSGAAVLLERLLEYAIFYLACRHHITELHIGHANEDCHGMMTAPSDTLYKRFQATFGRMVLGQWVTWVWPADPQNWKFQHGDSLLQTFRRWMEDNVFPREDYQELLELAVILEGRLYVLVHMVDWWWASECGD